MRDESLFLEVLGNSNSDSNSGSNRTSSTTRTIVPVLVLIILMVVVVVLYENYYQKSNNNCQNHGYSGSTRFSDSSDRECTVVVRSKSMCCRSVKHQLCFFQSKHKRVNTYIA